MKTLTRISLYSAVLAALLLPAAAQNATTTSTPAQSTTTSAPPAKSQGPETGQQIQNRRENQQDRISQGIASGKLTAGEASNLETKMSDINHEEADMRKLDNGHLTKADRATLQQQQNQLSKQIYRDKHNNVNGSTASTTKYGQRRENLQDRIASGLNKHELDAGETASLENEQRNINQEIAKDKAANGGHLTAQEKKQINAQQNKVSKQIKNDERRAKPMNRRNK